MYLLWEKSRQKGLKVAKYCLKSKSHALVCEMRELMAAGGGYCCGPPQVKRERLSVGVSTVPEHTERAVAARPGKVYVWETLHILVHSASQFKCIDLLLINSSKLTNSVTPRYTVNSI